eukprot:TRINITY_DN7853_c0_g2_i2.p1 TRINITY_DN7853_c0_g2~~TRINITY_DN7853_c0_g2_i2.p1  ORF type:complete len:303 (+),score=52.31 TRINITY_DN7853_c0_g2_i2:204-1112(+)
MKLMSHMLILAFGSALMKAAVLDIGLDSPGKPFNFLPIGTAKDAARYNRSENQFLSFLCLHQSSYYGSFHQCEHLAFHLDQVDDALAAVAAAPANAGTWVYVGDLKGRVETRSSRQAVTNTLPLAAAPQLVSSKPSADCVPAALVNLGVISSAEYDEWLEWQTQACGRYPRIGTHVPIGFAIQAIRALGRFAVRKSSREVELPTTGLLLIVELKHVYGVDAASGLLYDSANPGAVQLTLPLTAEQIDDYSGTTAWHTYQFISNPNPTRRHRAKRSKRLPASVVEVLEQTYVRWASHHGILLP